MMLFGRRHEMCQLLIAFLMCMPLAGRGTSSSSSTTTVSSTVSNDESNKTTSSTKLWFELNEEDMTKVDITTMSVAAVAALLNLIVIIAIVIDPLKILRRGPWVIILNLATTDLISCISAFCLWGDKVFNKTQSDLYYATVDFGWGFGVSASFLLLTLVAVQIFILTKFPLKSRYCLTKLKIALVCISLWLFACLSGFSNIAWVHFPGPDNLKIYAAQIGVLQIALVVQIVLNIQVVVEIIRSGRSTGNAHYAKHRDIAKTVIILTLIPSLTAFPAYFVMKQIEFLVRSGYFGQNETAIALYGLSYCYTPIGILNFGTNPILYALRLPDYRQTLLAFVGKKRNGRPRRSTQNTSLSLRTQITSVA